MGYGPSRGWGNPDTGVRALPPECGPGDVQPVDNRQTGVRGLPTCGPDGAQPVDGRDDEVTVTGSDRPTGRDVGVGMGLSPRLGRGRADVETADAHGGNRSGPGRPGT
ncbi:hypothetical protein AB0C47_27010 [Micromonospora taraxaci]|uniref:hypothetical protein n=1 Tax=Micromonospora taraxaci TaxID=1316803 RepID=UPI0033D2F3DF